MPASPPPPQRHRRTHGRHPAARRRRRAVPVAVLGLVAVCGYAGAGLLRHGAPGTDGALVGVPSAHVAVAALRPSGSANSLARVGEQRATRGSARLALPAAALPKRAPT